MFRIKRGPESWGRLLYEAEWVGHSFVRNGVLIYFSLLIVILGLYVSIIGLIEFPNRYDLKFPEAPLIIIIGGLFGLIIGFGIIIIEFKTMPFRIYEVGLTITSVPLLKGIQRREELIRNEDIISISIRDIENSTITRQIIKIYFRRKTDDSEMNLSDGNDTINTKKIVDILSQNVVLNNKIEIR